MIEREVIEPYHTGIIVEDLATAIPIWEAATGVPWGSVFAGCGLNCELSGMRGPRRG